MDIIKCKNTIYCLKMEGLPFCIKGGYLVPISFDYQQKLPECVNLLSKWRIENPSLSPTRFPVSDERTEQWLNKTILKNDFRIMFMIQNEERKSIGHIGLSEMNFDTSTIRIDSVMRGVKDDTPGIIKCSIDYLKNWCKKELNADYVDLVVLDDNTKAINLYHSCGFQEENSIPLKKVENGNEINWIEDYSIKEPEKRFIYMKCTL